MGILKIIINSLCYQNVMSYRKNTFIPVMGKS